MGDPGTLGLINRFNALSARLAPLGQAPCVRREAVLSLTFDDFPKSAWTVGGPVLAAHDARATYYVSGRFEGIEEDGLRYFDRDDIIALAAAGHEVGCHTFSHRRWTDFSTAAFAADRARNLTFLDDVLPGYTVGSFAYPYGDVSLRLKAAVARSRAAARGIRPGVNGDPMDMALLLAAPMERRSWSAEAIDILAREAAATGGWLILFGHDVSEDPSPYGSTPAMLETIFETASRHGLRLAPVAEAARARTGAAEAA
jgi:peptidoglycan/xylan/chitin deacetylase (PgdA/CDA1 family)